MGKIFSIREASKFLGVSQDTLRVWDDLGKFKCDFKTVGGRRRYREETILAKLEEAKGGKRLKNEVKEEVK